MSVQVCTVPSAVPPVRVMVMEPLPKVVLTVKPMLEEVVTLLMLLEEEGVKAEGIIVDLHVVRVAPRIGIASGTDPKKIEKQLMESIPEKDWGEIGMAISFLGREICRPTNPKHNECVMKESCDYFKSLHK